MKTLNESRNMTAKTQTFDDPRGAENGSFEVTPTPGGWRVRHTYENYTCFVPRRHMMDFASAHGFTIES